MDRIKNLVVESRFRYLAMDLYSVFKRDKNAEYDRQTIRIMKTVLKKGSNCVDVGAHKGDLLNKMVKMAPEGKHMAFEPLPDLYEGLKRRFPGVEVYNYALSDSTGKASFNHVVNAPGYSGLQVRDYGDTRPTISVVNVDTTTLDRIYPEGRRLDMIKADIEGGEYNMFKGARDTIKRNRPVIVFEFGIGGAEYYNVTPEMMYELLVSDYGLKLSMLRGWPDIALTLEEFKNYYNNGEYYFVAHP